MAAAPHAGGGAGWVLARPLRPPRTGNQHTRPRISQTANEPSPLSRIFRRLPASSSFVLAAARLRALQLDSCPRGEKDQQLRGRIQKNSQPSPAARLVTGLTSYALLTPVALMGAADRVFLDCHGADIRVRRACRTRPVAPHGKADRGSRRRGEPGSPGRDVRCCRNSRTSPGWPAADRMPGDPG